MTRKRIIFIVVLSALALAVRGALAPLPGNLFDLAVFKTWGLVSVARGFGAIYSGTEELSRVPLSFPNYALFLPYLRLVSWIHLRFIAPALGPDPWQFTALLKLLAIAGDIVLALLAERFVRRRVGKRAGLAVFLAIAFNPALIYTSAVWGQTDSLHTLFLFLAVASASSAFLSGAWASVAAAALFKVQSVLLLPLLCIVHLRQRGFFSLVGHGLAAAAGAALLTAPFWIRDPGGVFGSLRRTVSLFPYVSVNAMNVWWPAMITPSGMPRLDTEILFGAVTYRTAGFVLLLLALAFLAVLAWRARLEAGNLVILAALFFLAFFLFSTEMHERYLYPAVVFLIIAAAFELRLALPAFFLSISFLVNLLLVTPLSVVGAQPVPLSGASPVDLLAVNLWWVVNLAVFVSALMVMILRVHNERRLR